MGAVPDSLKVSLMPKLPRTRRGWDVYYPYEFPERRGECLSGWRFLWWTVEEVLCFLFGHRYTVIQEFGPSQRRVGCTRCRREWAMHDGEQAFLPWDGEFEELYRWEGYHILKW